MLTLTSIITCSVLAVVTVGSLAVLADGAVQSELERAVRGDLAFLGRIPAPVRVARGDERYVAKGLDRSRLGSPCGVVFEAIENLGFAHMIAFGLPNVSVSTLRRC